VEKTATKIFCARSLDSQARTPLDFGVDFGPS
jgi:hypothetical protein